jgi:hypothetical protein
MNNIATGRLALSLVVSFGLLGCLDDAVSGGEGGAGGAGSTTGDEGTADVQTVGATGPGDDGCGDGGAGTGQTSVGQVTVQTAAAAQTSVGQTAAATTGAGGPAWTPAATSQRLSDLPAGFIEGMCGSPSSCGDDPDTLVIVVDAQAPLCEAPFGMEIQAEEGWRVAFAIPPEKQVPGVYPLDQHRDIGINVWAQIMEPSSGVGAVGAAGGGGSPYQVLEIVAIDGLAVTIRLEGIHAGYEGTDENGNDIMTIDSDGEYVTVPCPQ